MRLTAIIVGAGIIAAGGPSRALSQPSLDSLAERTTHAAARFADRRVAVAEGYRRLGTDFPGMGEHWLHPRAVVNGAIDPARPALLTYAAIDGMPTLLGTGFVIVTRGDSQPTGVPGWPHAWHEHSGLFSDESGAAPGRSSSATRVWVLHVWTHLTNPAGRYAPDNWALPFTRAGRAVPDGVDADAARAFSLTVGGDRYLHDVLTDAGLATELNRAAVDSVIARSRSLASHAPPSDLATLRSVWRGLGASLRRILGAAVDPYIAPPHTAHHDR